MTLQEKHSHNLCYYQGEGFSPGVAQGFSTRVGGVSQGDFSTCNLISSRGDQPSHVQENYRRFHHAVGCTATAFARNAQVHGDQIRLVTQGISLEALCHPQGTFPPGDGLITQVPQLALWVYSADCVPLLYYDPKEQAIGAVHTGWRGTALGIAEKTVVAMGKAFGTQPQNLEVVMGPSIGSCCFHCHQDVAEPMRTALGDAVNPSLRPYKTPTGEEKFAIDLQGINALWLEKAGVTKISASPPCTACHLDKFWSHRKLGEARGSMGAMISLEGGKR